MLATGLKLYLIGSSASIEASNSLLSRKLKFKRIELVEKDMAMLMRFAVAVAAFICHAINGGLCAIISRSFSRSSDAE